MAQLTTDDYISLYAWPGTNNSTYILLNYTSDGEKKNAKISSNASLVTSPIRQKENLNKRIRKSGAFLPPYLPFGVMKVLGYSNKLLLKNLNF